MNHFEYRVETIPVNENGCLQCAVLERLRELGKDGWRASSQQPDNAPASGWVPAGSKTVWLEREVPGRSAD